MENIGNNSKQVEDSDIQIEKIADSPEEAQAVIEITKIIGEVPGMDQVFSHEINKLGISPQDSLKQAQKEMNFGAAVGDNNIMIGESMEISKPQLEFNEQENRESQQILAEKGFTTIEMDIITDDPQRYSNILAEGKKQNKHGHLVWGHTAEELSDGRMLFATKDNGICISVCPDGDVCSFVRNPTICPDRKGIIPTAMMNVFSVKTETVKHTECYGEATARAYEKLGFEVIGYYGWDKNDQPADWPDWDTSRPNMYFLVHNGDSAKEVAEKYGTYSQSTDEQLKALPYFGPKQCPEIYEYSKAIRIAKSTNDESIISQKMQEANQIYLNKRSELNSINR